MTDKRVRRGDHSPRYLWVSGLASGLIAVGAVVVGSQFDRRHQWLPHSVTLAWAAVVLLLVAGSFAVRRLAEGLGKLVTRESYAGAGAIVRLVANGAGYVVLILAVLGVLGVSPQHLLLGAGIAGIVLGIAAQQSLGNIFASLVLLFARPFRVGDRIRIRSGVVGVLDARVKGIGLTYVTVETEDGQLMIPNSLMMMAGIAQLNDSQDPPGTPSDAQSPRPPRDAP